MSHDTFQKKTFAGISSFRMINAFRNGIMYSFMGLYLREQLQLSVTESNLLFTLIELIGASAQFFVWGYIADRYKARSSLIIMAETIPALGYIGLFFLTRRLLVIHGLHITGLVIVFGFSALEFFWGAGFVGYYTLLADVPNPKIRTKYQGYTLTMMSVGRISGSIIGGLFYDWKYPGGGFGEGLLYFILTPLILGFVGLILVTRKSIESSSRIQHDPLEHSDTEHESDSKIATKHFVIRNVSSNRVFYWLLIGIIISSIGQGAVEQTTLYFLRLPESIGASSALIGLLSVVLWLGLSISGPIAGKLTEFNVSTWYLATLAWFGVMPILYSIIGLIPGSVGLTIILFASRGISMGIFSVASFNVLVKIIPIEKRGRLLSQYNAGLMMGWGVGGSLVGGPLADYLLSRNMSLASAYLATFFAAFLIGMIAISITVWKVRPALLRLYKLESR